MKIRIRDNTIRLRLTRTEVNALAAGQAVESVTRFNPTDTLRCVIASGAASAPARASFTAGEIAIAVPAGRIAGWAESNDVGITIDQRVDANFTLTILIEKDFACLHRDGSDTSDTYPNPNA